MNEHEAQRIAAAMHELRPDWPASSLFTIIRKNLLDKPRRDVAVALAWIACESGTHNPARVLETGPWWKAASVEGASTGGRRDWPDDAHRCRTCSLPQAECDRLWQDHPFEPISDQKRDPDTIAKITAALRQAKAEPVEPAPKPPTSTEGTERVAPVRAAIAAARADGDADA